MTEFREPLFDDLKLLLETLKRVLDYVHVNCERGGNLLTTLNVNVSVM